LAGWVDEYHLVFPSMPAAIAGLGIHGIESANGKLIKQRAAEAEEQRLEVAGESSEGGRRA
jgi:isopentenyl diphosphate isomerase/L-lactate dehydrogenase-like FMN-dependent dehydrogenase